MDILEKIDEKLNEGDQTIIDREEVTNIIYDTLMSNKQHPQFDLKKVKRQEVNAGKGRITFSYAGNNYMVRVEPV